MSALSIVSVPESAERKVKTHAEIQQEARVARATAEVNAILERHGCVLYPFLQYTPMAIVPSAKIIPKEVANG